MAIQTEEHVEIPAKKARGATRGSHVFVIWAISTVAVSLGLFGLYALAVAG